MELVINNNLFNVKTVMTQRDIQKGMMGRKFDKNFNGMLFLMPDKKHSFWMKDCIVPLDIIFIDGNEITKIHSNCEPCHEKNCPHYEGFGDMVLELEGGTCERLGIEEGDIIKGFMTH